MKAETTEPTLTCTADPLILPPLELFVSARHKLRVRAAAVGVWVELVCMTRDGQEDLWHQCYLSGEQTAGLSAYLAEFFAVCTSLPAVAPTLH